MCQPQSMPERVPMQANNRLAGAPPMAASTMQATAMTEAAVAQQTWKAWLVLTVWAGR